MTEPTLHTALQAFCSERRYSPAMVERWMRLDNDDAAALLQLAQEVRPSENQLRDLWQWADDIAHRDGQALALVLTDDALMAARRRHLGRNDRLKLLMHALRRRRFPQLAAVEDRLAELAQDLGLPRAVRLSLPPFLEGDAVRVEIVASSATALHDAAAALARAAETAACRELFTLLGEAP